MPPDNSPDDAAALLGVFAHPDDEEFGTAGALLRCVARGVRVQLLMATRGDAGEISDPALARRDTLAEVREGELREACRLLGFAEPIFLDYCDGAVAEANRDELIRAVVGAIRRFQPRVVLTFDANGGYGHADHIAIHQATVAACQIAADPWFAPELGAPHRPDKLYATAYPRWRASEMNADFARYGLPAIDFGDVRTIPMEEIGTADERVTTVVPVDDLWERRWLAFRAHRTQFGAASPFLRLPEHVVRRWMQSDFFVRLIPAPAAGTPLPDENDLWAGLPLPGAEKSG